jgi:hypothetical protein
MSQPQKQSPWSPPACAVCGEPREIQHAPEFCSAMILRRMDERLERLEKAAGIKDGKSGTDTVSDG